MAEEQDEATTLAQLAAVNEKVNAQEARGLAMLAAKDTTIGELNDLVVQLQNKPNMTSAQIVEAINTISTNLEDNFVAAQEPPTP